MVLTGNWFRGTASSTHGPPVEQIDGEAAFVTQPGQVIVVEFCFDEGLLPVRELVGASDAPVTDPGHVTPEGPVATIQSQLRQLVPQTIRLVNADAAAHRASVLTGPGESPNMRIF